MATQRKSIPKDKALEIYQNAFVKAGILVEADDSPEKNWSKKLSMTLFERGYLQVTHEKNDEIEQYSLYLKDRYNSIKRLIQQPFQKEFGYFDDKFQPLIAFSLSFPDLKGNSIFPKTVAFTSTPFHYLNFWRSVETGTLHFSNSGVAFKSGGKSMIIRSVYNVQEYRMPRESQKLWLKVSWNEDHQNHNSFFSIYQSEGQLGQPKELSDAFTSILSSK